MASNGRTFPSKDSNIEALKAFDAIRNENDAAIALTNKRREIHFKASHGLIVGFFLWILYALTIRTPKPG